MRNWLAPLALLALAPALGSCGLQPLYTGGANAGVAGGIGTLDVGFAKVLKAKTCRLGAGNGVFEEVGGAIAATIIHQQIFHPSLGIGLLQQTINQPWQIRFAIVNRHNHRHRREKCNGLDRYFVSNHRSVGHGQLNLQRHLQVVLPPIRRELTWVCG